MRKTYSGVRRVRMGIELMRAWVSWCASAGFQALEDWSGLELAGLEDGPSSVMRKGQVFPQGLSQSSAPRERF
jgi:hypothetical protein